VSILVPYQIPRNGLVWLLASMFGAILPHITRLPVWLTLVCLLCGGWRVMVYRGRWALPTGLIRVVLVFSGGAAVFGHYGTLAGPEAGTALLILGFCFKLMETRQRRDAFIVVILGYFVVAASFFFDQSLLGAGYMALVCIMITAALLGLNQSPLHTRPRRTLTASLRLLGHSLPMMLALFVLVPRLGPVWSLDLGGGQAKTGLSDRITPGDIAQLSRSDARAFRVEFDTGQEADSALVADSNSGPSPIPPPSERYWRALVLSHYDGKTWSRGPVDMDTEPGAQWGEVPAGWQPKLKPELPRYRYRVMMEPTDQRWLFAMAWARSDSRGVGSSRDYRLVSRSPVRQAFSYRVESIAGAGLDSEGLPTWLQRMNLQLPADGNPRTRALAHQLRSQSASPEAYISQVQAMFAELPFRYTLRPPRLSGDRIDQFLFDSRSGFCSHYAGAFVFLMRAAGLPARIVAGYQGGEINPLGGYLLVHQFDAHAWAEVWLPGQGWVRADPTAFVAPERVEQGIEQALAGDGSFLENSLFSALRYRHLAWLSQLRLSWDYLNFTWHRLVLGYDAKAQQQLLARWFDRVDLRVLGVTLLLVVSLVMALLAIWLLRQNIGDRQRDPGLRCYRRLCRKMARRGMALEPAETPSVYLTRLAEQRPVEARQLRQIEQLLTRLLYTPEAGQRELLINLRKLIRTL
jgi:transglutaminase-like putative cysteine protease